MLVLVKITLTGGHVFNTTVKNSNKNQQHTVVGAKPA